MSNKRDNVNSMKTHNKLEGATNYRAWKKRMDLIGFCSREGQGTNR